MDRRLRFGLAVARSATPPTWTGTSRTSRTSVWGWVSIAVLVAVTACTDPTVTPEGDANGSTSETVPDPATESATGSPTGPGSEPLPDGAAPATLIRLGDGDSGWFRIGGGPGEESAGEDVEVRLLDYNAPEKYEHDGDATPGCNGAAATDALAALIDGADTVAVTGTERDRYGRLLVDLLVDGNSAVERLVADGRGLAIGDPGPLRDRMKEAAASRVGIWGDGCGRPAASGLEVDRVEPDPPGRDEEDLNGEWVELVNRGSEPIDLTGWDIRDDSSSHRFGLAGVLGPGDTLTVRTGSGSDGAGVLHLGSTSPVWSNGTDTVLVLDPDGVVAAWAFIG